MISEVFVASLQMALVQVSVKRQLTLAGETREWLVDSYSTCHVRAYMCTLPPRWGSSLPFVSGVI